MIKKVVTFDEFRDEFLEKLAEAKKIAIADPSSDKAKRYHHKIARLFNERKPDNFAEITKEHLTPKRVWEKHVIGILTIQQKSSDDTVSNAAKLLSYCDCKEGIKSYKPGEEAEFFKTNNKLKNIRFADKKAEALAFNLKYFIKRETEIIERLEKLQTAAMTKNDKEQLLEIERETAFYLQRLHMVGPKTARNVLQLLGLNHHIIPIDSRALDILEDKLGIELKTQSCENQYWKNEDILINIAEQAGILSPELDSYFFLYKDLLEICQDPMTKGTKRKKRKTKRRAKKSS